MASVPRLSRSIAVMQKRILWAAAPSLLLVSVSCKQRTMNESASPDSIGASYDGKENFVWPLIKQQLNDPAASKEVCWYTYQIDQSASASQREAPQYTPQQIRGFFLKANAVGGASARYVQLAAFKTEAQGAAQANNQKFWGTVGSCYTGGVLVGASFNSQSSRAGKAITALTSLLCIGSLGRMLLKNPRNDDTAQDSKVASNFSSFSANSFLEDVRIPPLEHKSLLKNIEKTLAADLKKPQDKGGDKCPSATDALAQVDATIVSRQAIWRYCNQINWLKNLFVA